MNQPLTEPGEEPSIPATRPSDGHPFLQFFETAPKSEQARILKQLAGNVYETAPPDVRGRLVEHLMRPLGVLALVALADGVFAHIRLRNDWQGLQVHLDDVMGVQTADFIALFDRAQQLSAEAVNSLAHVMANSPALAGSAATAALIMVLLRRAQVQASTGADNAEI